MATNATTNATTESKGGVFSWLHDNPLFSISPSSGAPAPDQPVQTAASQGNSTHKLLMTLDAQQVVANLSNSFGAAIARMQAAQDAHLSALHTATATISNAANTLINTTEDRFNQSMAVISGAKSIGNTPISELMSSMAPNDVVVPVKTATGAPAPPAMSILPFNQSQNGTNFIEWKVKAASDLINSKISAVESLLLQAPAQPTNASAATDTVQAMAPVDKPIIISNTTIAPVAIPAPDIGDLMISATEIDKIEDIKTDITSDIISNEAGQRNLLAQASIPSGNTSAAEAIAELQDQVTAIKANVARATAGVVIQAAQQVQGVKTAVAGAASQAALKVQQLKTNVDSAVAGAVSQAVQTKANVTIAAVRAATKKAHQVQQAVQNITNQAQAIKANVTLAAVAVAARKAQLVQSAVQNITNQAQAIKANVTLAAVAVAARKAQLVQSAVQNITTQAQAIKANVTLAAVAVAARKAQLVQSAVQNITNQAQAIKANVTLAAVAVAARKAQLVQSAVQNITNQAQAIKANVTTAVTGVVKQTLEMKTNATLTAISAANQQAAAVKAQVQNVANNVTSAVSGAVQQVVKVKTSATAAALTAVRSKVDAIQGAVAANATITGFPAGLVMG
jgi:hypothetical protein